MPGHDAAHRQRTRGRIAGDSEVNRGPTPSRGAMPGLRSAISAQRQRQRGPKETLRKRARRVNEPSGRVEQTSEPTGNAGRLSVFRSLAKDPEEYGRSAIRSRGMPLHEGHFSSHTYRCQMNPKDFFACYRARSSRLRPPPRFGQRFAVFHAPE